MKKLCYVLLLLPFIFSACSNDDDPDEFTRDVDYNIIALIDEFETPPIPKIIIHADGDLYIEGYSCYPLTTSYESDGTLYITFGDLKYTRVWNWCGTVAGSTDVSDNLIDGSYRSIGFSNEITKIVMIRKGITDTYNVEISEGLINIVPQQTSFTRFYYEKYLTRVENSFGIWFGLYYKDLTNDFFEYVNASVPITAYEYDSNITSLWYMMKEDGQKKVFLYENASDYTEIARLFKEFCKKQRSLNKGFYGALENWTGDYIASESE